MRLRPVVRCRIVAFAFCAFVIAPIAYMLMDRQRPYDWLAGEIVPPIPHPGGEVSVKWTMKTYRYCEGVINRQVVDSHNVVWGYDARPSALADQLDANSVLVRTFRLPENISPGPARYSAHACYTCNPLQRIAWPICVRTPDVHFVIQ
jgi:hypothetical protein